jgi:hypothetical protein
MKKIWMHKSHSFEEADEFDKDYYSSMGPEERLETVQFLREMYFKFKGPYQDEDRKRLRRTIKIIQQK